MDALFSGIAQAEKDEDSDSDEEENKEMANNTQQ